MTQDTRPPLSFGLAIPCLIFVLAGVTIRRYRAAIPAPLAVAATLILAASVLIATNLSDPLDLKKGDLGTPVLSVVTAIAISVGLVIVAESTEGIITGRARTIILKLAACAFMVVLTHAAVLWLLSTPPTGSWYAFALALVVPWSAALVLLRTKASPHLLGVGRPHQTAQQRPSLPDTT